GAARPDGARARPQPGDARASPRAIAHPHARVDCAAMRNAFLVSFLLGCATAQSANPVQPAQTADAAPAAQASPVPSAAPAAVLQSASRTARLQYPPTRRANLAETL